MSRDNAGHPRARARLDCKGGGVTFEDTRLHLPYTAAYIGSSVTPVTPDLLIRLTRSIGSPRIYGEIMLSLASTSLTPGVSITISLAQAQSLCVRT